MAESTITAVIREVDPFYADRPHLDFQFLRRAGLAHLGELSGQIWTDHNTHDPGVTILEALCYALIDLGYRATMPIEDLLARASGGSSPAGAFAADDNFFTPLEILSCNPTTIADYRKLLLEVDGVRNAWLEPAKSNDPAFYLVGDPAGESTTNHLVCNPPPPSAPPPDASRISLNGLYRVLIEKEPVADDDEIFTGVQKLLSGHRNLCEDFQDFVVLCPFEIGICADVEIEKVAEADVVYEAILNAIQSYVAPAIHYYTLKQLLDKGKAIDEIFAGRPFLEKSVGFIDLDELTNLPLRKELYASDLYRSIKEIDGVVSIRDLLFQTDGPASESGGNIQRLRVPDRYVASFSLDRTCIQLRVGPSVRQFDKTIAHKRLAVSGKADLVRQDLDLRIPEGRFDPARSIFDSVQNDFPRVYGIGEGGLPADATLLRQVQARQLQGYLLFYDQLLANYLAQMANFRSLFSRQEESTRSPSDRHTYFNHGLEGVPGLTQLLQLSAGRDLSDGSVLAVPVENNDTLQRTLKELDPRKDLHVEGSCGSEEGALPHLAHGMHTLREVSLRQSMRDLAQGDYEIEIYKDKGGHFFILRFTQVSTWLLISCLRYGKSADAREAANYAAFLATQPQYYRKTTQQNGDAEIDYRFDLVSNLTADAAYLQHLLENEELYLERREAFLNHLLARFANQFTDYALLQYGVAETNGQERGQAIEDKSRFLSHFDKLSRNRGRAFNYMDPSWGSENVSGYEMRASMLAGITAWTRRRLCKFEVVESLKTEATRRIFSEIPRDDNIRASQFVYVLQLKDSAGNVRQQSGKKDYAQAPQAWGGLSTFLEEIRGTAELGLELEETREGSRTYFDNRQLQREIQTLVSYKWHCYDEHLQRSGGSDAAFPDLATAVADFVQHGDWERYITMEGDFRWQLKNADGEVVLASSEPFGDANAAVNGLLEAMAVARTARNYQLAGSADNPDYCIELHAPDERVLGITPPLNSTDAGERNAAFQTLRETLNRLPEPITEDIPQYRWRLIRVADGEPVRESSQAFPSKDEAARDFEETIRRIAGEEPPSEIARSVYTITLLEVPARYRFVYCVDSADGQALSLLHSQQEFESRESAEQAYTEFIRALPRLTRTESAIGDGNQAIAVLTEDTEENREQADKLLALIHQQYGEDGEVSSQPKWIYRLVDKDHPIARTVACDETKGAAQEKLIGACGFKPYRIRCENQLIRIVCPPLDPERFHYAICFPNEAGEEVTFLISYLGYESREAAQDAGAANGIKLIELAADNSNYGKGKQIALEETYGTSTDVCTNTAPYRAVLAKEFWTTVDDAVELARRYPIRIAYKKDQYDKPTKEAEGYSSQGYDLESKTTIWQSAKVYATVDKTLEAYQLFVVVLGNPDSCRIVCEKGRYCIQLVEILAESGEFETEDDAWGEPQTTAKDACGRRVCMNQGVRLFAEAAIADTAFIPQYESDCFQFTVVGKGYIVARHTCTYPSTETRDKALNQVHDLASSCKSGNYSPRLTDPTDQGCYFRYYIGEDYYFESIQAFPDWKEAEMVQTADRWFYLAGRSANYRPIGNEWQLCDPLQGLADQTECGEAGEDSGKKFVPVANVSREITAGGFDIDYFKKLTREYPVFKKGDRYCFRLYYPDNGAVLDEELQPCCGEEPKTDEREKRPFCGKAYLFESADCYDCRAAAEEAFKQFCDLAKDLGNYRDEAESGSGPYTFSIIDPAEVLAKHPHCHPDAAGAMRASERARACIKDGGMHLVEHILLRPQAYRQNAGCECLLPVCPDLDCELTWEDDLDEDDPCAATKNPPLQCIPGSDPYSFWATLVLPGWHPRFQSKEKRQFFSEMLHREVPAMVGLNILWLSPKQMCEFDEAFRSWLDWFRDPGLLCEDRDQALCNLVNCIKQLRNDAPCPIPEAASAEECECLPAPEERPYRCIEPADQLFWLECDSEELPTEHENEGIARAEIPVAAMEENTEAPAAARESVVVDPSAIRQTIAKREAAYRENIQAAPGEQVRATEGYKQAEFFVSTPPSIVAFGKLVMQIIDHDMGRRRTKRYDSFNSILQNATWYLLDKSVQTSPSEVPEDVKADLPMLLAAMKSKGMDTKRMARDWKSKTLQRVLDAAAIQEYLKLFNTA